MAYSKHTIPNSDGSTDTFPISFTLGFISRDDVTCQVNNEVDGLGNPVYRSLEWINDGLVKVLGGNLGTVLNPVKVEFLRTVSKQELIHNYADGEPIEEKNLDESNLQNLMALHEVLDGRFSALDNTIDMNNNQIKNVGDGTDPGDAVNLSQLEDMTGNAPAYAASAAASAAAALASKNAAATSETNAGNSAIAAQNSADAAAALAAGFKFKNSVRVATTANITLSGLLTIDGITLVAGNRVLVKNQTTTAQNGIYIVASGAWTRATDMDAWGEVPGAVTIVEVGTSLADSAWLCTSDQGGTIGTTAITWVTFPVFIADNTLSGLKLADGSIPAAKLEAAAKALLQQIVPRSVSADTSFALTDAGGAVFHPSTDTVARVFTIPANASVAFPVGTAITIDNDVGAGAITIAITSDTLVLAGSGITGSRTLAAGGLATIYKNKTTGWKISGVGLT